MKIFILLLIFGAVFSRNSYTTVTNVYYNYKYDLNKIYKENWDKYSFRAEVIPGDDMDFEILIENVDINHYYFNIYAREYTYKADDEDILNENSGSVAPVDSYKKSTEGKYTVFSYHYKAGKGVNYLGIYIDFTNYWAWSSIYFRLNVFKYKYSNIKNLEYNTDYEIDTSIFTNRLIPMGYLIYIRIPVESKDNMEIQITTKKAYNNNQTAFKVDVCQYTYEPSDSQVYYGTNSRKCETDLKNESNENMKFVYPFETVEDIEYLSICITNNHDDLSYLYLYIYSEKGLAAAIIVLIILLPLLLIGGGTGFYIKRRRREKI